MAEMMVEETRLREIVDELVQKHLKSSIDDVEELRRSPAGTILRLEERVEFIQKNMATQAQVLALESRVESIEQNMATKADLANLHTEFNERIGKVETTLNGRIGKLETGQRIMLTVLFTFFSAIIAMLIKLVFFP